MLNSERLYTNLLFRASRKYASWDPEIPIEVGDYGHITAGRKGWIFWRQEQGVFLKEGNIYKDGQADKFGVPLPKEHGANATEGQSWITSKTAKEIDVEAAVGGQTPALAQCKVKAAYQFNSKMGAVLVMDNDTISTIDPPGKLRFLYDDESLHGKVVVSEVHRCSSYARFFTAGKTSSIAIGLSVEPPVSDVVAGTVEAKWIRSASSGNFKTRITKNGQREYYPLFRLVSLDDKGLSNGMRGGDDEENPPLPDAIAPWMEEEDNAETNSGSNATAEPISAVNGPRERNKQRFNLFSRSPV